MMLSSEQIGLFFVWMVLSVLAFGLWAFILSPRFQESSKMAMGRFVNLPLDVKLNLLLGVLQLFLVIFGIKLFL